MRAKTGETAGTFPSDAEVEEFQRLYAAKAAELHSIKEELLRMRATQELLLSKLDNLVEVVAALKNK